MATTEIGELAEGLHDILGTLPGRGYVTVMASWVSTEGLPLTLTISGGDVEDDADEERDVERPSTADQQDRTLGLIADRVQVAAAAARAIVEETATDPSVDLVPLYAGALFDILQAATGETMSMEGMKV